MTSTRRLNAHAYTVGEDVVLESRDLGVLRHEVGHVLQQRRGGAAPGVSPHAGSERGDGSGRGTTIGAGPGLQRQSKNLKALTDDALQAERDLVQSRLNAPTSYPDHDADATYLDEVLVELWQRGLYVPPPDDWERLKPRIPAKPKPVIRVDYQADEHPFRGVEMAYTADVQGVAVNTPGVYKSSFYWIAPHLRSGTDRVVFYVAYNPEMKRNEYVIGPDSISGFLAHETLARVNAAAAYPMAGDMPKYKADSVRVMTRSMRGDFSGAWDAWKSSWTEAAQDPGFWIEATLSTAALADVPHPTPKGVKPPAPVRPLAPKAIEAPAPVAKPTPPAVTKPTPPAVTEAVAPPKAALPPAETPVATLKVATPPAETPVATPKASPPPAATSVAKPQASTAAKTSMPPPKPKPKQKPAAPPKSGKPAATSTTAATTTTAGGSRSAAPVESWKSLTERAQAATPRQTTGGYRSNTARAGDRGVVVVEGPVSPQIPQKNTMAHYGETLPGEHATHSVGLQSGENLPEGLTSAPGGFNTGDMKVVENAIKKTNDRAAQVGAKVETRTTTRIEYRATPTGEVPVLVGVEREAWVVLPGTDRTFTFARFAADVDPVTRAVTVTTNKVIRPPL